MGYDTLESWKKTNVKNYYETNFNYLDEVAANPVPYLEISWTTRFNAFLPADNVWNYLTPETTIPENNYETDQEGQKIWPLAGKNIDTVNIMAYDAGGIKFNFETILKNFVAYSGDPSIAAKVKSCPGTRGFTPLPGAGIRIERRPEAHVCMGTSRTLDQVHCSRLVAILRRHSRLI